MIHRGYRIFNTTLEEYRVLYPDETSNYIKKDAFDGALDILL